MAQYTGIQYNSPFVGAFLFAPDYINLLENIGILSTPFCFISTKESHWISCINSTYPIGIWKDYNIEIHFLHYASEAEVLEKWSRRIMRLNMDNLLVKFCDRDYCTDELVERFSKLPFKHKICFSAREYPYEGVVCLKEQKALPYVDSCWKISDKYWNFVQEANLIGGYSNSLFTRLITYFTAHINL